MTKADLLAAISHLPPNAEIRAFIGNSDESFNGIIIDPHGTIYLLDNWRRQLPTLELTPTDPEILHLNTL